MTGDFPSQVPFQAHVELLQLFLAHRKALVERIQNVLNAQRKPVQDLQDRAMLTLLFEGCFFTLPDVTEGQSRLRGQLEEARAASGFRPRRMPELHNDLISPAEMMIRGFFCWRQTRWPGRNGRIRYAEALFNVYVIRCLVLLSIRLWDAGPGGAGERLAQLQNLLDVLWRGAPHDQPVILRDARWLIPLAQSPTTDDLAAYFEVAEHVIETLSEDDSVEIQKAHVRMIGGHLCSQIRHYCVRDGLTLDEESVVRRTRTSNALDFALLIQGLVSLLEAYDSARRNGDDQRRLDLAGAICQAISADPELFLNRVDLLGAYSMIEHLFIATNDEGQAAYTPMGQRHIRLLQEYGPLIDRQTKPLFEDCANFRPLDGTCSPYGVIFGTPSNLTEHMALKTLQPEGVTRFSLEDVFVDGDAGGEKLTWVNGWRKLPHIDPEMQKRFDYPQQFAEEIFDRIEREFRKRVSGGEESDAHRTGRLILLDQDDKKSDSATSQIPELPARFIESSDPQIVAAGKAESCDQTALLHNRQEGHFAVSFETPGGWVAIKKDFLTEVLGAGHDAKMAGLPRAAAGVLRLMCPDMVVSADELSGRQESMPPSMSNA